MSIEVVRRPAGMSGGGHAPTLRCRVLGQHVAGAQVLDWPQQSSETGMLHSAAYMQPNASTFKRACQHRLSSNVLNYLTIKVDNNAFVVYARGRIRPLALLNLEFLMATRIQIAKPDIVKTFSQGARVLRVHDLARIFHQSRDFWRLTKSSSLRTFTAFMVEKTELKAVRFAFPQREVSGYTWGNVPLLETLLGLVDRSYYSHYTAIRIHGLTEQVPKTIYLSQEKSSGSAFEKDESEIYEQGAIDAAFKRPPRVSNNEVELPQDQVRAVMLSSAYQAGLGITEGEVNYGGNRPLKLRYTNLERTMIDIVVRPFYAGGISEVAKAFENAKDQLSVNTMAAMLKRMRFGYPYHQAVGYYLERAGYKVTLLDLFRKQPMERDFYLTHGAGKTVYNHHWRLHVSDGF